MSTMDEWDSRHPYRRRMIVSAGMLVVGGALAMSTMWVWRPSLFAIGQILNGLGIVTALFTLFQYINRPREVIYPQTMHQPRELKYEGYSSQNYRKDR